MTFLGHLAGDPDTSSSIGHARREVEDAGSFVSTCQSSLVIRPFSRIIRLDVFTVLIGKLLDSLLNVPSQNKETFSVNTFNKVLTYLHVYFTFHISNALAFSEKLAFSVAQALF